MAFLSTLDESGVYGKQYRAFRAENANVFARDLKQNQYRFVDMMSAYGAVNFGHCNPNITPFEQYNVDLVAGMHSEAAEDVAAWLVSRIGDKERKTIFQVGGSFAVSSAIGLAQHYRPGKVLHVQGSFHGLGIDALSISDCGQDASFHFTQLNRQVQAQMQTISCGEEISDWSDISCFIFEPIQGANGYVPLDLQWLKAITSSAAENGVVVISDEIQAGFFRHGFFSPSAELGIYTDITLFSKSLTNGLYPLSAVVYSKHLEAGYARSIALAHTFQTSALGIAAAKSTMTYIDQHKPEKYIPVISNQLARTAKMLSENGLAKNIHHLSASLSFELPDSLSKCVVQTSLAKGVIIFPGGEKAQRIRIAPPLTINEADLKLALSLIYEAVSET